MEYIYAVYQEGSISKAAEKLFITQPALSMAIRRVEKALNVVLFDRSQHPLKLTNIGEIYIQKYRELKILKNELISQINDINQLQKGELSIGGTHFILSYVLAPVLSDFSQRHPEIDIRLFECSSDKLETLLLNGRIDLCLKCDDCNPALEPIDYAFRDYLLMAIPQKYVVQYGLPDIGMTLDMVKKGDYLNDNHTFIDFKFLENLPYLVLTTGNNLRERFMKIFEQNRVKPNIKMQIEQIVTAYGLADNGMGATLTSAMIIKKSSSNNLIYYKVDSPLMIRDFSIVGRRKRYISNASAGFIDILKSYYAPKP